MPAWRSPLYRLHHRLVDLESYVNVHTFRYEVPARFIGRQLEVRETKTEIQIFDGPRLVATHPRRVEGPKRARLPASERAERKRHRDEQLVAEQRQLLAELPEFGNWIAELCRRAPRGQRIARLRQLRRLLRDYPEPPLHHALREAARYGLYDLDRVETIILRRIKDDYFPHNATSTTTTTSDPCASTMLDQLLKNLHLGKIREVLEDELKLAESKQFAYAELLLRLLRAEWHGKQESALNWHIKRAALPEQWTLESFPFKRQPGVSRRQIQGFASLDFVSRAENIVFIGGTAVGKTGLATGLLLKALQNGHRGLFLKAQDLFDEMYASLADRSSRKLLNRLARVDLLVIDEMGYLNLRPEQTNVFFRLMEERYRRKATIITTNLDYERWHSFLGNQALCDALLSRIRHHCHTIRIDGPPLREPSG